MSEEKVELPQGTLDLLILRTLALEPQHGWAIAERAAKISSDVLRVQQGSLYPALHRLERRGWIKARWGASENNRRAKYYELTAAGRKQLESRDEDLAQAGRSGCASARYGIRAIGLRRCAASICRADFTSAFGNVA